MKDVSIEGCPVIGTGTFGKVYRLDADTVVKVYDDPANLPLIQTEQDRARRAFIKGIPTAIPFGIVRVGDTYGSVFELLDAWNCSDFIASHPDKADTIIAEYADLIRRLHTVRAQTEEFPDTRTMYLDYLRCIREHISAKMYTCLAEFVKSVPKSQFLIHGDLQMKNIMLSDEGMYLIDMNTMSAGDIVFEFAANYRTYIAFNIYDPDDTKKFMGVDKELADRIYYGSAELLGIDGDRKDIQILAWLRFLHVLIVEHSAPDDYKIAPTLERLTMLLREV